MLILLLVSMVFLFSFVNRQFIEKLIIIKREEFHFFFLVFFPSKVYHFRPVASCLSPKCLTQRRANLDPMSSSSTLSWRGASRKRLLCVSSTRAPHYCARRRQWSTLKLPSQVRTLFFPIFKMALLLLLHATGPASCCAYSTLHTGVPPLAPGRYLSQDVCFTCLMNPLYAPCGGFFLFWAL